MNKFEKKDIALIIMGILLIGALSYVVYGIAIQKGFEKAEQEYARDGQCPVLIAGIDQNTNQTVNILGKIVLKSYADDYAERWCLERIGGGQ